MKIFFFVTGGVCVYLRIGLAKSTIVCVNDCFHVVHIEQKGQQSIVDASVIATSWLPVFRIFENYFMYVVFYAIKSGCCRVCVKYGIWTRMGAYR